MALADTELLIPDEPMQGWHPTETPETRRNPVRGFAADPGVDVQRLTVVRPLAGSPLRPDRTDVLRAL
jgi:hypothetical protein